MKNIEEGINLQRLKIACRYVDSFKTSKPILKLVSGLPLRKIEFAINISTMAVTVEITKNKACILASNPPSKSFMLRFSKPKYHTNATTIVKRPITTDL